MSRDACSGRHRGKLETACRLDLAARPPLVVTTPALFFDDGIYDDPFASNARTISAGLKHNFANGHLLEASASWMAKDYNGLLALDFLGEPFGGEPLRNDKVQRASAGWTIPLFGQTSPVGADLNIDYYYTRHRSNDVFYNYTSHALGVNATISY